MIAQMALYYPPEFIQRVREAVAMLNRGATNADVREVHGAVILREALYQIENPESLTTLWRRVPRMPRRTAKPLRKR